MQPGIEFISDCAHVGTLDKMGQNTTLAAGQRPESWEPVTW